GLVLLGGAVVRGACGAGAARSARGFAVARRRAAAIRRRHGAGAREQRLKAQRRELFGEPPEGLGLLRRRAACQRPQRARHAVEQRRRRRAAGLQNAARGVSQALQRGLLVSGGLVERAAPSACEHLPLGGVQARPRLEQLVEARALHAKQLVDGPGRHGGFLQGANGRGRCAVAFGQLAGQPVALGREVLERQTVERVDAWLEIVGNAHRLSPTGTVCPRRALVSAPLAAAAQAPGDKMGRAHHTRLPLPLLPSGPGGVRGAQLAGPQQGQGLASKLAGPRPGRRWPAAWLDRPRTPGASVQYLEELTGCLLPASVRPPPMQHLLRPPLRVRLLSWLPFVTSAALVAFAIQLALTRPLTAAIVITLSALVLAPQLD